MGFKTSGAYVSPKAANPYMEDVAEFAKANADKPDESFTIDVPAIEQSRHELWVRDAAHAVGKTARRRKVDKSKVTVNGQTESGRDILTGTVFITYTLRVKDKEGKGRRASVESAESEGKTK